MNYGNFSIPDDDYHQVFDYYKEAVDSLWWKNLFPVSKKTISGLYEGLSFANWNSTHDIDWSRTSYDDRMNITEDSVYVDQNGTNKTPYWIRNSWIYDGYGNLTQTVTRDLEGHEYVSRTTYDPTYHTFVEKVSLPPASSSSSSLVTQTQFEPRFGLKIEERDFNGVITYKIPQDGLGGFGRIIKYERTNPYTGNLVLAGRFEYAVDSLSGNSFKAYHRKLWENTGDASWGWKQELTDGFGRLYKKLAPGYNNANVVEFSNHYDSRGNLSHQGISHFYNPQKGIHYHAGGPASKEASIVRTYNDQGNPLEVLNPEKTNFEKHYLFEGLEYDLHNQNQVYIKKPDPSNDENFIIWSKQYDSNGNIHQLVGPYDENKQIINITDTVEYIYDCLGRLIIVIDPTGDTTRYTRNSIGQIISYKKPETGVVYYKYDSRGPLIETQNSAGITKNILDGLGRVTRVFTVSNTHDTTGLMEYFYDLDTMNYGKGRICLSRFEGGKVFKRYNLAGDIIRETVKYDSLPIGFITHYTYNADKSVNSISYPGNYHVSYNYDTYGGIGSIVASSTDTLVIYANRYANGKSGYERFRNGVEAYRSFDILGLPDTTRIDRKAFVPSYTVKVWNKANKLTRDVDLRDILETNRTKRYTYSRSGSLESCYSDDEFLTYTYQYGGNRIRDSRSDYTYDQHKAHQIIKGTDTAQVVTDYDYFSEGPVKSKISGNKRTLYDFDPSNHLLKIRQDSAGEKSTLAQYQYAGNRRTYAKTIRSEVFYVSPIFNVIKSGNDITYKSYVLGERGV